MKPIYRVIEASAAGDASLSGITLSEALLLSWVLGGVGIGRLLSVWPLNS